MSDDGELPKDPALRACWLLCDACARGAANDSTVGRDDLDLARERAKDALAVAGIPLPDHSGDE